MEPFYEYIDANSQIIIDEFKGDGVKYISRFLSQYEDMPFADQSIYNIMFKQVVHKGEE